MERLADKVTAWSGGENHLPFNELISLCEVSCSQKDGGKESSVRHLPNDFALAETTPEAMPQ